MTEADDDFFLFQAGAYIALGLIGRGVALLNLQRNFIRTAVLGPAQRADRAR